MTKKTITEKRFYIYVDRSFYKKDSYMVVDRTTGLPVDETVTKRGAELSARNFNNGTFKP